MAADRALSAAPIGAVNNSRNIAAADAKVEQVTIAASQQFARNPGPFAPALDLCGKPRRETCSRRAGCGTKSGTIETM
jgi:hypothetical protein